MIKGKTCKYSDDAVTTPCGGLSSLETLGDFTGNFFVVVFINTAMFLKDELMCRYFHGIAMNRRDPRVFLQSDKYSQNE